MAGMVVINPSIHVFRSFGEGYLAYFTLVGSVAQVSDEWAEWLSKIERGERSVAETLEMLTRENLDAANGFYRLVEERYLVEASEVGSSRFNHSDLLAHAPRSLMLLVTDACNLKCVYCYEVGQGVHSLGRNMSRETAEQTIEGFIRDSGNRGQLLITFFGGEPLMNFSLVRHVVEYATRRCNDMGKEVCFTTTTNMTLMTEEIADYLVEHKFTVMVSIDGPEEDHDRFRIDRQGRGTHSRVVNALQMLIKKFADAGLRAPKLRATLAPGGSSYEEVYQYLHTLGTPLVEIGSTLTEPGTDIRIQPDIDEALQEMDLAAQRVLDKGLERGVPKHLRKGLEGLARKLEESTNLERAGASLCGACRNMKAVSAVGDIYPCHRYVGMEGFNLGSIHKGGSSPAKVVEYYKKVENTLGVACSRCWAHVLCGGFCPWTMSKGDGTITPLDEVECKRMQLSLESQLRLYAACRDVNDNKQPRE